MCARAPPSRRVARRVVANRGRPPTREMEGSAGFTLVGSERRRKRRGGGVAPPPPRSSSSLRFASTLALTSRSLLAPSAITRRPPSHRQHSAPNTRALIHPRPDCACNPRPNCTCNSPAQTPALASGGVGRRLALAPAVARAAAARRMGTCGYSILDPSTSICPTPSRKTSMRAPRRRAASKCIGKRGRGSEGDRRSAVACEARMRAAQL